MSVTQVACQIMIPMKTNDTNMKATYAFIYAHSAQTHLKGNLGKSWPLIMDHGPFPTENWLSILTLLMFLTLATKTPAWAVVLPLASFPRLLWYCGVSHSDKLSVSLWHCCTTASWLNVLPLKPSPQSVIHFWTLPTWNGLHAFQHHVHHQPSSRKPSGTPGLSPRT